MEYPSELGDLGGVEHAALSYSLVPLLGQIVPPASVLPGISSVDELALFRRLSDRN